MNSNCMQLGEVNQGKPIMCVLALIFPPPFYFLNSSSTESRQTSSVFSPSTRSVSLAMS